MEVVFRIIGSEDDMASLNPEEEYIHFCFRPSEKEIFDAIRTCPKIKIIQLPVSYFNTLSNTTKTLMSMNNIEIKVGNVWGHRTDIDTHKTLDI